MMNNRILIFHNNIVTLLKENAWGENFVRMIWFSLYIPIQYITINATYLFTFFSFACRPICYYLCQTAGEMFDQIWVNLVFVYELNKSLSLILNACMPINLNTQTDCLIFMVGSMRKMSMNLKP